jgi:hypothetical protein
MENMRPLRGLGYLVCLLVAVAAAVVAANSITALYMVGAGYVAPGEPMYLDELAPTMKEAAVLLLASVGTIAVALFACASLRRRKNDHAS